LMPPPVRRFMRLRLWLLTVGGPLGCAGVIVAIRVLGVPSVGGAGRLWPLQAISTGAFLILLGRLFPMSIPVGRTYVPSDGLTLWRIPRLPPQAAIDSFISCYPLAARDEVLHGSPEAALEICRQGR